MKLCISYISIYTPDLSCRLLGDSDSDYQPQVFYKDNERSIQMVKMLVTNVLFPWRLPTHQMCMFCLCTCENVDILYGP